MKKILLSIFPIFISLGCTKEDFEAGIYTLGVIIIIFIYFIFIDPWIKKPYRKYKQKERDELLVKNRDEKRKKIEKRRKKIIHDNEKSKWGWLDDIYEYVEDNGSRYNFLTIPELKNKLSSRNLSLDSSSTKNKKEYIRILIENEWTSECENLLQEQYQKFRWNNDSKVLDDEIELIEAMDALYGKWTLNNDLEIKAYKILKEGTHYTGLTIPDLKKELSKRDLNLDGISSRKKEDYIRALVVDDVRFQMEKENDDETLDEDEENDLIEGSGTGFMIDDKGIVVTNSHVVSEAVNIDISFPELDKKYKAKILIQDKVNDLAVLELLYYKKSDLGKRKIPFAKPGNLSMGKKIHTIGFPLGRDYSESPRLSSGIVNSVLGPGDDPRSFQTSIPIQPGNSGGVVFDDKCQFIGVIFGSLNDEYFISTTGAVAQNMNFALKFKYLEVLLDTKDIKIKFSNNEYEDMDLPSLVKMITPFVCQIFCKINV